MKNNKENIKLTDLGNQLRKAREKANLTQLEVAEASDVSTNYYAQMERGEVNPSVEKLQKVKQALKIKDLKI